MALKIFKIDFEYSKYHSRRRVGSILGDNCEKVDFSVCLTMECSWIVSIFYAGCEIFLMCAASRGSQAPEQRPSQKLSDTSFWHGNLCSITKSQANYKATLSTQTKNISKGVGCEINLVKGKNQKTTVPLCMLDMLETFFEKCKYTETCIWWFVQRQRKYSQKIFFGWVDGLFSSMKEGNAESSAAKRKSKNLWLEKRFEKERSWLWSVYVRFETNANTLGITVLMSSVIHIVFLNGSE